MAVSVRPESFTLVDYDAAAIAAVATLVLVDVGLSADTDVHIEVDESSIRTRGTIVALGPTVSLAVAGGAFEDRSRPRHFSELESRTELTRLLSRVADRLTPAFASAPPEDSISAEQDVAWDASALGRASRRGLEVHEPRLRYDFQLRLGFTAAGDAAFDRLWSADNPRWEEVVAAVEEASAGS